MSQKYVSGYRAQTRARAARYILSISGAILLLAVLQTTLFARARIFGAIPDLMLCAVICIAYFLGRYAGAVTGIGAGVLIEALGSVGVSILPVVYLLCGYLAGHYARAVTPKRYGAYLVYLAVALPVRAATTLTYACLSYHSIDLPKILLQTVLPELVATAICGCVLYVPLMLLGRAIDKP